jgi:hypothetical protein
MNLIRRKTKSAALGLTLFIATPVIIACDAIESQSTSQDFIESIADASCSNIAQMYGDWDVSLLFDLNQPPSSTLMLVAGDGDNVISGSFYDTPFSTADVTMITGGFVLAAATADNSGEYIHMARYDCAKDIYLGQTWSRGRNFVMSWAAVRQ